MKAELTSNTIRTIESCLQAELNRTRCEMEMVVNSQMPLNELRDKVPKILRLQMELERALEEMSKVKGIK